MLKHDFSYNYDGQLLLSNKAKVRLEKVSSTKINFHLVNAAPIVFVPEVSETVNFNVEKRKTRFIELCKDCGEYESIVRSTPPFLIDGSIVDSFGIYKPDILFGRIDYINDGISNEFRK